MTSFHRLILVLISLKVWFLLLGRIRNSVIFKTKIFFFFWNWKFIFFRKMDFERDCYIWMCFVLFWWEVWYGSKNGELMLLKVRWWQKQSKKFFLFFFVGRGRVIIGFGDIIKKRRGITILELFKINFYLITTFERENEIFFMRNLRIFVIFSQKIIFIFF